MITFWCDEISPKIISSLSLLFFFFSHWKSAGLWRARPYIHSTEVNCTFPLAQQVYCIEWNLCILFSRLSSTDPYLKCVVCEVQSIGYHIFMSKINYNPNMKRAKIKHSPTANANVLVPIHWHNSILLFALRLQIFAQFCTACAYVLLFSPPGTTARTWSPWRTTQRSWRSSWITSTGRHPTTPCVSPTLQLQNNPLVILFLWLSLKLRCSYLIINLIIIYILYILTIDYKTWTYIHKYK